MKRPCVRDLKVFRKAGCPEKTWDGNGGCPMWVDGEMPKHQGPGMEWVHCCQDELMYRFNYSMGALLAGNQIATESFRNGMVMKDEKTGATLPKPDRATLLVLSMFRNEILKRNIINEHELKKLLDGKLFGMGEEQLAIEQEEDEGTEKGRTGEV